ADVVSRCNKKRASDDGAFELSAQKSRDRRAIWLSLYQPLGRYYWSRDVVESVLGPPSGRDERENPGWLIHGSVLRLRTRTFGLDTALEYIWATDSDPYAVIEIQDRAAMPGEADILARLKDYCVGSAVPWADGMIAEAFRSSNPFPFATSGGQTL